MSVQVRSIIEGVRRRPGMYVGDTDDGSGLHHMLWELVGNVIDLHLARRANEVRVEVTADAWVTVRDDGPGIPGSMLSEVMEQSRSSPSFDGHHPHIHFAFEMRGCGLAPVNALSTRVEIETTHAGVRWARAYERGVPVEELRCLGPSSIDGTTVRFRPDPEIFSTIELDPGHVATRLQELAWLCPLLRVFFQERRLDGRGGAQAWVDRLAVERGEIEARYAAPSRHVGDVFVDLALAWSGSGPSAIRTFVNLQESVDGSHLDGLWTGFDACARRLGALARGVGEVRHALAPGLTAIVHVGLFSPEFKNPSRDHLRSPKAGTAVCQALERDLPAALERDPDLARFLRARLGIDAPT